MKLSTLHLDLAAIEGGIWVDNIPGLGDMRVLTKGVGNAAFRALNTELVRALARSGAAGADLTTEQAESIEGQLLLQTCLLGWDTLTGDDGEPVPYSLELASTFITDPSYRPLRAGFAWAAAQVGARNRARVEADLKN